MSWMVGIAKNHMKDIARDQLSDLGLETYFPVFRERVIFRRKRIWREQFLLGRYFFISFTDSWREVFQIVGLSGLLKAPGGEGKPSIVEDNKVDLIRDYTGDRRRETYTNGEPLKYQGNASAGLDIHAIFDCTSTEDRVFVFLNLFGGQHRAEVDSADLSRYPADWRWI